MPFAENLGTGGGTLDAQYGSAPTVNANAPLLLDHDGTNYAYLPGLSGNYLGVTDSAALDITGDLDVRVLVMLDDWNTGAEQTLSAKFTNLSANRSWQFRIGTTGALQLVTSADGTAILTHTSSVVPSLFSGVAYWLRATIDVASGANRVVQFFQAPFSATTPVAWTQIGSTITTAGTTSIFNSAAPFTLGSINAGLGTFGAGRFYRAQVLNGISGTVVLDTNLSTMITTGSETAMLSTGPGSPVIPEPFGALPNLGWGGFGLNARYGSAVGPDTNDPLLLTRTGENYVYLPGVASNFVVMGDPLQLGATTELDVRVALVADSWTGTTQVIAAQGPSVTAANLRFVLALNSDATLRLITSNGSVSSSPATSTALSGTALLAVRATWRGSDGLVSYYSKATTSATAAVDAASNIGWTAIGTGTATVGSLNVSPQLLSFGAYNTGTLPANGKYYYGQVAATIDGSPFASVDFTTGIVNGAQTSLAISGTAADQLDNALVLTNLGTGGPLLNAQRGSNLAAADTNDPQVLPHSGTNYLYLPGVANNYAFAPDSAALDITGDIDLRVHLAMDDWTPAVRGHLLGKYAESTDGYALEILADGTLRLNWQSSSGARVAISSVATGLADGTVKWVRATLDVDNGASGRDVAFYLSDDGTTWTQLGTTITQAGTTDIVPGPRSLAIGAYSNAPSILTIAAKVYRAQVLDGIGGTVAFDADFTTGITTGAQTTFTESSVNAATVTINRSTSGRKSVAVVQPTLLFGTDDYLRVTNNALLNFGAADSFTLVAAVRQWATPTLDGTYIGKWQGGNGYYLCTNGTTLAPMMVLRSPATLSYSPVMVAGQTSTIASVTNRSTGLVATYTNAVAGGSVAIAPGSVENADDFFIGSLSPSSFRQDFEFYGAAVWRRALSAAEIATVSDHYAGTVTPASLALLGEAVLWIDAARSKQAAAISRSTSGRKSVAVTRDTMLFGTDDYLEVPDSDLLDFGADDSFTFLMIVRQWNTAVNNARYMSKRSGAGGSGYVIASTGSAGVQAYVEGATGSQLATNTAGLGNLSTLSAVSVIASTILYTGEIASAPAIGTRGNIANANSLRFGQDPTVIAYAYGAFEFFGAAVFRRALTAGEIATVNDHYQTGPTTASTALLREAVLWLDPAQRSSMTLNRASSGRRSVAVPTAVWSLATDDFFEVPDSVLLDMGAGQDFTALVIQRPWWLQGSSDTLVAKVDTTTVTAQGWAVSNPTTGDALSTAGRIGDGSAGVEAFGAQRLTGQRQAVVLVRSGGTLTAWTGGTAGTPVAATTGDLSNGSVMRIGRLSGAGAEYLDSEIRAVAVWRRALSTAEITAVLNYYGAA